MPRWAVVTAYWPSGKNGTSSMHCAWMSRQIPWRAAVSGASNQAAISASVRSLVDQPG